MTAAMFDAPSLPEALFEVIADSLGDEAAWLAVRKDGIGASDVASTLGLYRWKSAYRLWAEKTGRVAPEDLSENEPVFWGKHFEHPIITGYAARTRRAVVRFGLTVRPFKYPWLFATPDAFTTDDEEAARRAPQLIRLVATMRKLLKQKRNVPIDLSAELLRLCEGWWPLQVKNIGLHSADDWMEGVPEYYRLQCQQEALLFGTSRCTGAAVVGGQALIWDDIKRDEMSDRILISRTKRWWQEHVLEDIAPEVDGSESTTDALKAMWPRTRPESVLQLSVVLQDQAARRDVIKEKLKALEAELSLIDNQVREAMQDAEEARFPDGTGFTYKLVNYAAKTVVHEARSHRTLLRKKKPSDKKPRTKKAVCATPEAEETT